MKESEILELAGAIIEMVKKHTDSVVVAIAAMQIASAAISSATPCSQSVEVRS